MPQGLPFRIANTLLFLFVSNLLVAQFTYQPRRANLNMSYSEEKGWVITDITGSKIIAKLQSKNAFIQITGEEVKIYEMPERLWNIHSSPLFLDKLNIPYSTHSIPYDSARFDLFSALWISAEGGHIRVFKRKQSVNIQTKAGRTEQRSNQNIGNHIFINRYRKAKISSTTNVFMIAPQGNIFEIDQSRNIWRLILTNRTVTPWSSTSPTDKMVFQIFKQEDFKTVIPIGIKDNKYWFQIINHSNKMGLASLTSNYFQITYEIPPLFDFISPSLINDFHLVYNENKLGILFFHPSKTKYDLPVFETIYTNAQKSLMADGALNRTAELLSDGQKFSVTSKGKQYSSMDFTTTSRYGIEILDNHKIIANESQPSSNKTHSGLYNYQQNKWFIFPSKDFLTPYSESNLETTTTNLPFKNSYSVYSKNGMSIYQNVSDLDSHDFMHVTATITNLKIDSMVRIPEFTKPTFKFRVAKKWGVIQIINADFKILVKPDYLWVDQFGSKESLILAKESTFDWFGVIYGSSDSNYHWLNDFPEISLDKNNKPVTKRWATQDTFASVILFGTRYIYNSNGRAKVINQVTQELEVTSSKVSILNNFLWSKPFTNISSSLYTRDLKLIETAFFDSAFATEESIILLNTQKPTLLNLTDSTEITSFGVAACIYKDKKVKSIVKYPEILFHENLFVAKNKDGIWIVFDVSGKQPISRSFSSPTEGIEAINELKKL